MKFYVLTETDGQPGKEHWVEKGYTRSKAVVDAWLTGYPRSCKEIDLRDTGIRSCFKMLYGPATISSKVCLENPAKVKVPKLKKKKRTKYKCWPCLVINLKGI